MQVEWQDVHIGLSKVKLIAMAWNRYSLRGEIGAVEL